MTGYSLQYLGKLKVSQADELAAAWRLTKGQKVPNKRAQKKMREDFKEFKQAWKEGKLWPTKQ